MNKKISKNTAGASSAYKAIKSWSQPLAGVVIVFVIWYLVCKTEILSAYVLPPPEKVFRSFLKMLQSGELARDIGISFLRVLKGFAIAFVLALCLACSGHCFRESPVTMNMQSSFSATCRLSA